MTAPGRDANVEFDTRAVDYGRVNSSGDLVAQPFSYRDGRTREALDPSPR